MGLQIEKTAGFIAILTEKLYFDRAVYLYLADSICHRAWCQWSSFHCPCPSLGMVQQELFCSRRQQSQNSQQNLPQSRGANAQGGLLAHSWRLHPPPFFMWAAHQTHTWISSNRVSRSQSPANQFKKKDWQIHQAGRLPNLPWVLCYSLIILTSKGHQINCVKLPGTYILLLFPYLMSSLKINGHLLHC